MIPRPFDVDGWRLTFDQVAERYASLIDAAMTVSRRESYFFLAAAAFCRQVSRSGELYAHLVGAECLIQVPIEEERYRRDEHLIGAKQFVVQDPDGYLLRLSESLGVRTKQ